MPELTQMWDEAQQRIDANAQQALENNQKAMANLREAKRISAQAEKLARRAADYQDAKNALTSHTYLYRAQMQPQEMDWFWVRSRYDIIYNMYAGREAVNNYYLESTSEFKSRKLRLYGPQWGVENRRDNYGIGDLVLNMLHTPYVEVAGDGQTARESWGTFSYQTELMMDGYPLGQSSGSASGMGGVVRKEDGRWKIWVFGSGAEVQTGGTGRSGGEFDPTPTHLMPGDLAPAHDLGPTFLGNAALEQRGTQFSPGNVPRNEPALPLPYDTWDESQSVIALKKEAEEA